MTRKVVSPIALDKSINTTEQTPRNIADVLAQQLAAIKTAIESGNGNLEAAFVCYYGVTTATQIREAIEDGKVPYFYYNGVVAQLWKVETDKYTFRTTNTRSVEGQTILDVVDYVVNGSVWSTVTREVSGGSSSGQSYIASVNSLADFDTTGKSGMQDLVSVANVPADGVYQVSVMLHITPKTASATKSDLVLQFTSSDNTGWPSHTFHAVVDDSQTFAQQLSFSTSVSLKAGENTLRIQCGGLNTEYLVFVDELTVAQLVNGVYHNGDDFDEVHTLTEAADFNNDDGVLVDGATGGPRFMLWQTLANKVLGFIKSLFTTATEADLVAGNYLVLDGSAGTKKLPAEDVAKRSVQDVLVNEIDGYTKSVSTSNDAINVAINISAGDTFELLVNSSHSGDQFSVFAFYGSGPSDYDQLVSVTENVSSKRIAAKNYQLIRFYNAGRGYTAEGVVRVQGLTQDVDALEESVNGKVAVNTSSNDLIEVTVDINSGDSFELLVTTGHSGNLFSVFAFYGTGPSDYDELSSVLENTPSKYVASKDYSKIRFYKAGRGYAAECRVSVQGIQGVTQDVNGLYEIANGKTGITASSNDAVNVAVSIEEGDVFELLVSAAHSDGVFSVFAYYGSDVNDFDELESVTENVASKRIASKNYRLIRFYSSGRGYPATCRVSVQGVTQNVDDFSEVINGKVETKTSSSDIVDVPVGIKAGDNFELLATTNHSGGLFSVFAYYGAGPSDYEELAKVTENVPSEYIAGRDYIKIRFYKAGRGYSATCNVSVFGVSHRASVMAPVNILVIGDSFTRADHWVSECLSKLPEGSSVTSLAVISASVKDHYQDRTTYPYTSRPVSTDNTGNKNTFGCQIEKLKRLMTGVDLDPGEVQLYPNGTYPDIIIVEGGQNDTVDANMDNYSAQFVELKENVYYKNNSSSALVQGNCWAKSDIETIDRTCFAGAYRYVCETLKQLFPSSILMITTISNLNYWSKGIDIVANADKIASQQKWCAAACGAPVIDWQKCQISTLTTYPGGTGTSDDPYILSGNGQSYSDSDDGMHPNSRGDLKLGYYMANEIVKNYYKKYLL